MNLDLPVSTRIGKRHMRFDGKQLMVESLAILGKFNRYACVAGIAATILVVSPLLDIHPLVSLALGLAVYAGVTLLWPQDSTPEIVEPSDPDQEAFQQARQATTRVMILASQIDKPEVQQEVQEIGLAFDKMLNVMEEDKKYTEAPNYKDDLIDPFEVVLTDYVGLGKRGLEIVSHLIATFEEIVVPEVRGFTRSFYQHYHDDRVRDWAARIEIFWDRVSSHTEEVEDLDDITIDDNISDEFDGLEFDQEKEKRQ